jgi:hypothetical protein
MKVGGDHSVIILDVGVCHHIGAMHTKVSNSITVSEHMACRKLSEAQAAI